VGGILVIGKSHLNNQGLAMLNVYGPCTAWKTFWKSVEDSGLLTVKNLIMAGDFNLILNSNEAWEGDYNGNVD